MKISVRNHNHLGFNGVNVIKLFIIVSACVFISLSCKVPFALAFDVPEQQKTLIIAGVTNHTNNPEWDDFLIGHELSHLISEEFYNTGLFAPIENNPEIADKVYKLTEHTWKTDTISEAREDAISKAREMNSDVVAYAVVKSFSKSRSGLSLGPFSSAKVNINVKIEITLDIEGRRTFSATGKGKGVTKSAGVLFHIREDKIHFDATTVGIATCHAVKDAIGKLISQM